MKKAGLPEKQKSIVRKELIFNNAVCEQLRAKVNETTKHTVHQVHHFVAGKIVKKYRIQQAMCCRSGLNKNTVSTQTWRLQLTRRHL